MLARLLGLLRGFGSLALCGQLALLCACAAEECKDRDGDGRGEGCDRGSDCDDSDPKLGASCETALTTCSADPFAKGCVCYAGVVQLCYSGPAATEGVGQCLPGQHFCPQGLWTSCMGEVLPAIEQCNELDDDCDGLVDEGAQSPCGGCNRDCTGGVWGPPTVPFQASGELAVTDLGELTLAFTVSESTTVWVPNTGEGTLSKVDAQAATEIARYRVGGETPERVAVDHDGAAWVLSPSLERRSMLTKVAGGREVCEDRDADGLQTSAGPEEVLPLGQDDCVLLETAVGDAGEVARSLAIDGTRAPDRELAGNVWVGLQQGQRLLELDGETAEVLREVPIAGVAPLDSAFDPWGILWLIDRAGLLVRVDPALEPPRVEILEAPLRCYEFDSLASDAQGVLTLTGFSCEDVVVYDSRRDLWRYVKTEGVLDTRGVTVLGDQSWVVHTAGRLSRVRREPLAILQTFELAGEGISPLESTAISADSLGQLWIASSSGGPGGVGVLSRFDPEREQVTAQIPVGRLPRPRGDLTGDRRLGEFAPEASAGHVFEGCSEGTRWRSLHVAWSAGAGASIGVEARHATKRAELDTADWVALGTLPQDAEPYALGFDDNGVVEVRLTLRAAARLGAPRIGRVGLEWDCMGPD
jgi:streptogramin lyase